MRAVRGSRTGGAYGLVKVMRAFNCNAYREITKYRVRRKHFRRYGQPVGFLIEKVAPAAYRLRQHKTRRNYVRKGEEAYFPYLGEYKRRKQAAYHRAVYGKTAAPNIQYGYRVFKIAFKLKQNIIKPRAHYARWYYAKAHVYNRVLFQLFAPFFAICKANGNYHCRGHYYTVPVYVLPEKIERYPAWHVHLNNPPFMQKNYFAVNYTPLFITGQCRLCPPAFRVRRNPAY